MRPIAQTARHPARMITQASSDKPHHIAFLLDNLRGGGAERVVLAIAAGFAERGYAVDLLVCERRGELRDQIPDRVNLVELAPGSAVGGLWRALRCAGMTRGLLASVKAMRKVPRNFRYIAPLAHYLQQSQPELLFSALPKANITAVLAQSVAGVSTRVHVGVQNALSQRSARGKRDGKGQVHHLTPLLRECYHRAQGVVAASHGVGQDAVDFLGLDAGNVQVVYNPVSVAGCGTGAMPDHPWFSEPGPPVVLAIGRLVAQKNFHLLLHAVALASEDTELRLMILGGDPESADQMAHQKSLQEMADALGIADVVALPGYRANTQDYLRAAQLFALSSIYEGFGNVLVEALLAGCPVVSTDCPSGPAEILDNGRYGRLVPVNDAIALALAIREALAEQVDVDRLRERGLRFSPEQAVTGYEALFFPAA
jgi:glycosyltransferase involved in cell wall biosynthesis